MKRLSAVVERAEANRVALGMAGRFVGRKAMDFAFVAAGVVGAVSLIGGLLYALKAGTGDAVISFGRGAEVALGVALPPAVTIYTGVVAMGSVCAFVYYRFFDLQR